jgi:hemerythrin-like domain-containing protein
MDATVDRSFARKPHPIDQLVGEHELILRILDFASAEARRVEKGGPIRHDLWRKYLEFFGTFTAQSRHSEKEDVLFAALEQKGVPHDAGPTCCLRAEHGEMHTIRVRLAAALTDGDRPAICQLARQDVAELRQHIRMEDADVFPLARDLLDEATMAAIRAGMDRLEAQADAGARARYLAIAEELHRQCPDIDD